VSQIDWLNEMPRPVISAGLVESPKGTKNSATKAEEAAWSHISVILSYCSVVRDRSTIKNNIRNEIAQPHYHCCHPESSLENDGYP
jgi:hypothetical protein